MTLDKEWLEASFPPLSDFRRIGGGGQKWVLGATHPAHGRIVLKLFHPQTTDPDRPPREARAGEILDSPLVPSVFETGVTDSPFGEVIWIYEELVDGRTLREIIGEDIDSDRLLRWGRTLLGILAEAEENDIVHRDVKPRNIIIDDEDRSWLVDFGLARHLDLKSLTATEASRGVGTPGYSPPEQFMNMKGRIDHRSDLFGLGVTLYECVEGTNPFIEGAESRNQVFERVLNNQLPAIEEPLVESGAFQGLLLAMTRREQEHRPRSVREALDWMEDVCDEGGL